jgi:hypothetical protein
MHSHMVALNGMSYLIKRSGYAYRQKVTKEPVMHKYACNDEGRKGRPHGS